MLFSATLTTDPAKIRSLHLNEPKFVIVRNNKVQDYAIPSTLEVSNEFHIGYLLIKLYFHFRNV